MSFLKNLQQRKQNLEDHNNLMASLIPTVPADEQERRINICKSCEHLTEKLHRCKMCGCFMDAKTWLSGQKCPLDKWLEFPKK